MRQMTLRTKLSLTHAAVAVIVLVVVTLAFELAVVTSFERLARAQSARTAVRLARPLQVLYQRHGTWRAVRSVLAAADHSPLDTEAQRVLVANRQGTVVIDTLGRLEGQSLSGMQRAAAAPIMLNNITVGSVVATVAAGRLGALEDRFVRGIRRLLVLVSLGAAVCAVVAANLVARRVTRPLRLLTNATRQLSLPLPHASVALPVTTSDEVGELTSAFNQMVAELARQEHLRRRMVADIAHELRTPLSVLRIELEALEDGVVAPAPAAVESLKEEVELLSRLVDDLQLLSLAEAKQLTLAISPVEPAAVLARSAGRAAGRAQQRGIDVRLEPATGQSSVYADEQRLAQALDNLVENALRYTPPGGRITLSCRGAVAETLFIVGDTGPGIPPGELDHIFDRFYRTDQARARHTGGTGLGLTIVRGLVEAMGGRAWAESPPNQGATFVIALPSTKG